jgi:hypothetical protein
MTPSPRAGLYSFLVVVFAVIPFAFGLVRAVTTGSDFRYLWMAIASFVGAAAISAIGNARGPAPNVLSVWSGLAFVVAALLAAVTGVLLGARGVAGILIVSAAFGACFAASFAFHALARTRQRIAL